MATLFKNSALRKVLLWRGHKWFPTILAAHIMLSITIPGYQIAQIKIKYGALRYYVDRPKWWPRPGNIIWDFFRCEYYFYYVSDKITWWAESRTEKMLSKEIEEMKAKNE